jgi:transposase
VFCSRLHQKRRPTSRMAKLCSPVFNARLSNEQIRALPMDFADATLVHVANREKNREVFMLDRRDFSVYRLKRNRSFTIVPTL